jgi:hypothetical protein
VSHLKGIQPVKVSQSQPDLLSKISITLTPLLAKLLPYYLTGVVEDKKARAIL